MSGDGTRVSDEDLVLRARRGENDAWAVLYRRHRGAVAAYLARRAGCVDDVEDLVQETFIRLPQMAADYRGRCSVRVWLCGRVAAWTLRDYRRKDRHRYLSAVEAARGAALRPMVETAQEREARPLSGRVLAAVSRLTASQRRAVQLRYLDGLSTEQAATDAGCRPGAIAQGCVAARARLRADLADLARPAASALAELPRVQAVRTALAVVGREDVPAARAWLSERGVSVDGSYVYAIRNGRRGARPDRRFGRRVAATVNAEGVAA